MATSNNKSIQKFMFLGFGIFVFVGCYNATVINSNSGLAAKNNKRLDDLTGQVIPGRAIANWQKLPAPAIAAIPADGAQALPHTTPQTANYNSDNAQTEAPVEAAIRSDLQLNLVEVSNPNKWPQGVNHGQFSGSLSTNNGAIEVLSVNLPDGQALNISFSEMTGNVFEYEFGGETLSGIIYQVDPTSYLVNLNHGPFEGTRLKFQSSLSPIESEELANQVQEQLADGHNMEIGDFGAAAGTYAEVGFDHQADTDSSTQSFIF
jgi:hypothetical protein